MSLKIKVTKYDKEWSRLVRERDGKCRKCGRMSPWKLEAHHIMPRGRMATRLDIDNGMTLCVMCHKFGSEAVHNIGSKDFMIPLIGQEEYKRLEQKSLKNVSKVKAIEEFIEKYGKEDKS